MRYLNEETLRLVLVLAAAGLAVVTLIALRAAHRAYLRRLRCRQRLQDTGLGLTFDACAPEGADLSLEPFRMARLRIEPVNERETAHRD